MLGLCGGYQMLGSTVADPNGIEGLPATVEGLGLLGVDTILTDDKRLISITGTSFDGVSFSGYEMHVGETRGPDCTRPFSQIGDHTEGAVSANGRVVGTYVHGLFADDMQRGAWLTRLGAKSSNLNYEAEIDAVLDRLAAHMEKHLDLTALLRLAR